MLGIRSVVLKCLGFLGLTSLFARWYKCLCKIASQPLLQSNAIWAQLVQAKYHFFQFLDYLSLATLMFYYLAKDL